MQGGPKHLVKLFKHNPNLMPKHYSVMLKFSNCMLCLAPYQPTKTPTYNPCQAPNLCHHANTTNSDDHNHKPGSSLIFRPQPNKIVYLQALERAIHIKLCHDIAYFTGCEGAQVHQGTCIGRPCNACLCFVQMHMFGCPILLPSISVFQ